jgi:regulatory protein
MTSRSSGSDRPRPRGRARAEATPLEAAKALALRVLAFHARSEAQLRARLVRAGHEPVADEVLAWARRLGYLDDAAFARGTARALLARLGPRAAERKLRQAGVAAAEAAAAVARAAEERAAERVAERGPTASRAPREAPELTLCRAALARRLRGAGTAGLEPRDRARLARWLLGRGFSGGAVARALDLEAEPDA